MWRLLAFQAVIRAQLTYGLGVLPLLAHHAERLDAFQNLGLRLMLRIHPSFLSRITNEAIMVKANQLASKLDIVEREWGHLCKTYCFPNDLFTARLLCRDCQQSPALLSSPHQVLLLCRLYLLESFLGRKKLYPLLGLLFPSLDLSGLFV